MSKETVPVASIPVLRGRKVMLHFDRTVKRNAERVPSRDQVADLHRERDAIHLEPRSQERKSGSGIMDNKIAAIIEAIPQVLEPPSSPRREIGFDVHESSPRYARRRQ